MSMQPPPIDPLPGHEPRREEEIRRQDQLDDNVAAGAGMIALFAAAAFLTVLGIYLFSGTDDQPPLEKSSRVEAPAGKGNVQ